MPHESRHLADRGRSVGINWAGAVKNMEGDVASVAICHQVLLLSWQMLLSPCHHVIVVEGAVVNNIIGVVANLEFPYD